MTHASRIYNALGQPTQVSIPNGMTTVYTYDTRNRLTKIEHKDGSTVLDGWTYSLDDQRNITRTDQADVAGGSPASGAYRYYTLDHLGSTSGLYDGAKAKVAALAYTPYGASYGDVGPAPLPRYTGHLWDGAAGLHLAPYRAYAPALARWLSRDPLGMVDGPNVYGYVGQSPVSAFDRQGLAACSPWVPCDLYNRARCEVSCLASGGTYKTCLMQTCVVGHRWGKKCIRIIINGCPFKLCHPWPIPILKTKYVCTCHGTGRKPMPRFPDL